MVYYARTSSSNHLEHHGILGQKWGVRRFQNEDGTLTTAGKRRYQVMTDPTTGAQAKSSRFTPEQIEEAKSRGYTVEDVEEVDERGIQEAREHRKRMVAIGAAVVGTAIAALLIKKGIENRASQKAAIEESNKQLDEFRKKAGDKLFDLVDTRVPESASSKVSNIAKPSAFAKAKAARAGRQLEKLKVQKELNAISAKYKPAQDAATKASNAEWSKYISDLKKDLKTTSDANTKLVSNASGLAKAASYTSELIKKLDGK